MRNCPVSGEALAFLHESMVTPCSLNGPMVKKRRLRLFGAKGSIPISPNSPEPSPPLSHAAASLPRCQCTAQSLVEEYALMTVVSRRLHSLTLCRHDAQGLPRFDALFLDVNERNKDVTSTIHVARCLRCRL